MAKKLYAVTNIKGRDIEVKAGDSVNPEKFSKEELKALYDNGAVEVREEDEPDTDVPVEAPGPNTSVENPKAATE